MIAGVLGTFFGGPLADRFGKKKLLSFRCSVQRRLHYCYLTFLLCGLYRYFYALDLLALVVLV